MTRTSYNTQLGNSAPDITGKSKIYENRICFTDYQPSGREKSDYPSLMKFQEWVFLANPLQGDASIKGSPKDDLIEAGVAFNYFDFDNPTRPTSIHVLDGDAGDDLIYGGFGNNRAYGRAGDDLLFSGSDHGWNYLSGGLGCDQLVGHRNRQEGSEGVTFGFDEISFSSSTIKNISNRAKKSKKSKGTPKADSSNSFGLENADIITNFSSATGDHVGIRLSAFQADAVRFRAISTTAELDAAFASGDNFIYDQSTGYLHFDQNGSSAGFGKGGVFARLDGSPTVNAVDLITV